MTDDQITKEIAVLYQIRCAIGDPHGKLMQDEVVERIESMVSGLRVIATWTKNDERSGMSDIHERAMQSLGDKS